MHTLQRAKPPVKSRPSVRHMSSETAGAERGGGGDALVVGAIVFGGAVALSKAVQVVPANHVGIVDTFGIVKDQPLQSGLHVVNPLATVHVVSCKTELEEQQLWCPAKRV